MPVSWMCKKQTSISHSSTEAEIMSLDVSLRMMGFPLSIFGIWIYKCFILPQTNSTTPARSSARNPNTTSNKHTHNQTKILHDILELSNVDCVSSNAKSSQFGSMIYIFVASEAVITMIIKGRNPTMRHVSRTHRVALDGLFDRIILEPKIQIKYVDTRHQLADIDRWEFHT